MSLNNTDRSPTYRENCPDCSVLVGQEHVEACDVARCLNCKVQRLICQATIACQEKGLGGGDIWTGEWPGVLECRELGWYSVMTTAGWQSCSKDTPGAAEDLNRWVEHISKDSPESKEIGSIIGSWLKE